MLSNRQIIRFSAKYKVGDTVKLLGVGGVITRKVNAKLVEVLWEPHTDETVELHMRLGFSRTIIPWHTSKVLLRWNVDGYQLYVDGRPTKCIIGFADGTFDACILRGNLPESVWMFDVQMALNVLTDKQDGERSGNIIRDEQDASMVRP